MIAPPIPEAGPGVGYTSPVAGTGMPPIGRHPQPTPTPIRPSAEQIVQDILDIGFRNVGLLAVGRGPPLESRLSVTPLAFRRSMRPLAQIRFANASS